MNLGVVLLLSLLPLRLDAAPSADDGSAGRGLERIEGIALQEVTNDLKSRLEIAEAVQVELVDHNPLVMSVETLAGRSGPFVITADRDFIHELTPEETRAAIAHELGHVWIYTHQPYLQTERLANDVAMRVISRAAFEPVYAKVWARTGLPGNLVEFLGPPPSR